MNKAGVVRQKLLGKSIHPKDLIKKWKIVKGDLVEMRYGPETGKQGKVFRVLRKKNRLLVEGINISKRHTRHGQGGTQQGGYWFAEAPIHYCRLALVDPSTGKACRIRREIIDGVKQRVSKATNTIIPKPTNYYLKDRKLRQPGPKDTPPEVVLKKTFDEETLNPLKEKSWNSSTVTLNE